jgi:hypothetical protein
MPTEQGLDVTSVVQSLHLMRVSVERRALLIKLMVPEDQVQPPKDAAARPQKDLR